jgi:hypothetical protein
MIRKSGKRFSPGIMLLARKIPAESQSVRLDQPLKPTGDGVSFIGSGRSRRFGYRRGGRELYRRGRAR